MDKITTLIIILCFVLAGLLGLYGYQKAHGNIIINETFQIGPYDIHFVQRCELSQKTLEYYNATNCVGWADKGDIYIVTNRSRTAVYETCVHEKVHLILNLPYEQEEPICRTLQKTIRDDPDCDELMRLI